MSRYCAYQNNASNAKMSNPHISNSLTVSNIMPRTVNDFALTDEHPNDRGTLTFA